MIRYGYNDLMDSHKIETKLIEQVAEILKTECNCKEPTYLGSRKEELQEFMEAREAGVACMISNTYVVACEGSSFVKKFAVNIVYGFLRRNSRRPATTLGIPHTSLVEVGMVYHV